MTRTWAGLWLVALGVALGTGLDARRDRESAGEAILAGDFHVHAFPGDGALTTAQLQREARRRGLDVIALTGHNNQVGWRVGEALGFHGGDVLVVPGQELTAPGFHIIAVGITKPIDWTLTAVEAIGAIHRQGGAAIAAHPVTMLWAPRDAETLAGLDGAELAHPIRYQGQAFGDQLDEFFAAAREVNADISPVGSSDFHMAAPLGRCRTYVFVDERSVAGVVRALRRGMTVAADAEGRLFGRQELIERLTQHLGTREPPRPASSEKVAAILALLGLTLLSWPRVRQ